MDFYRYHKACFVTAWSNTWTTFWASFSFIQSGPTIRMMFPNSPALANNTPLFLHSSRIEAVSSGSHYFVTESFTNYTANIIPLPLTSPIRGLFFWIFLNYLIKNSPIFSAFYASFSYFRMFKTYIPKRHWRGPAP